MEFVCKLVMSGKFPGSPDVETWEISEREYDLLKDHLKSWAIKKVDNES